MSHRQSLRTLAVALLLGAISLTHTARTSASHSSAKPCGRVTVLRAEFGTYDGARQFVRRDPAVVPLAAGTRFGWRLKLSTPMTGVRFTEHFRTPAPADWFVAPGNGVTVHPDAAGATTVRDVVADRDGWIANHWTVSPDDPAGDAAMTVTVEDARPVTFRVRFERANLHREP